MRYFVTLLICTALWSGHIGADQKGPPVPDYAADKLADNLYVIHGPLAPPNEDNQGFMNNPAFVMTSEGVVIVDPGGTVQSGEMVLRVLKKLTDKPVVAVFNTHVHGDHWLGNQAVRAEYPDVAIYAHPNTIRRIRDGAGQQWVDLMDNLTHGKSRGTEIVPANVEIGHGDSITVGDTRFDVQHYATAHTDTDIMIAVNGNQILFMGDNLINGRLARTTEGNLKGLIEACDTAIAIKPGIIVPGHGQSGGMDMYNESMELFRILYATVREQYQEGVSDFEMKPAVVEALAAYSDWEEFDANIGRTINQAYLEIEAAEF
jgi:glyoxylase-like metal-dependent hydrolase (beta-lactamase superfamily II)